MKKNKPISDQVLKPTPTLIALVIAQTIAIPIAEAATIIVNGNGDNDFNCTLREAITTMNVGAQLANDCVNLLAGSPFETPFGTSDTINLLLPAASTISLSNGGLDINTDLVINGSNVTIKGDGSHRIITLDERGTNITLNDLILSGGKAIFPDQDGGAIMVDPPFEPGGNLYRKVDLELNGCVVTGNTSDRNGGGLSITVGDLSINNTRVEGNYAASQGGGVFQVGGGSRLNINNSTITNNTAGLGGGINKNSGSATINSSVISSNIAFDEGGGMILEARFSEIINTKISSNSATGKGGGIFFDRYLNSDFGTTALLNSTLSANEAVSGGGISIYGGHSVSLVGSTVSNNSTGAAGGGFWVQDSALQLANSTVSGNSAINRGGGIFSIGSTVKLRNSTLSDNVAPNSGGIESIVNGSLTVINSIIANSTGADCTSDQAFPIFFSIIEDGSCSTSALSVSPMLGPLKDNGGQTKTHALLPSSPAIDAGFDTSCSQEPVDDLDQRGRPRPNGQHCDMGSYEYEEEISFFVIPTKNGKTVIFGL